MNYKYSSFIVAGLIFFILQICACQRHEDVHATEHPAKIEKIADSELNRVTLSEKAIQRLDLQTDKVRLEKVKGSADQRLVVPYSALIYDPQGTTWIYTSPQPRTFVRHKVDVDFVEGDLVVLNEGPPAGTVIASVAVAELYGAEFGIGH